MNMSRASVNDLDLVAKIKELRSHNMSALKIGDQLGLSKNQVVGILNRLKDRGEDATTLKKLLKQEKINQEVRKTKAAKKRLSQLKAELEEKEKKEFRLFRHLYILDPRPTVIPEEGLELLAMPNNGCRYSVGTRKDGVHLFCSKPKEVGDYCKLHYKAVYNKVPA